MFVDRCLFLCPFVFGVVIVCPSLPTGKSAAVDTVFTCNQIHISQVEHNNKEETDDYKAWEHKISLTYIYVSVTCTIYCIRVIIFWRHWYGIIPPILLKCLNQTREVSSRVHMCAWGIGFSSVFFIFRLDCWTVSAVWYYLVFLLWLVDDWCKIY